MRVGLLLSGRNQVGWFIRSIDNMLNDTDAEIKVIFLENKENSHKLKKSDKISKLLPNEVKQILPLCVKKLWAWIVYDKVDMSMVMTNELMEKVKKKSIFTINGLENVRTVEYTPIKKGNDRYLPQEIIDIATENCDIVINNSSGILAGDILEAPKHGVIGFHSGDIRKYRGVRSGFWEFLNNEAKTGVTLQRYTEELDAGHIIDYQEASISDVGSWSEVLIKKFCMSEQMLSNGIKNIQDPEYTPQKPEELGDLYLKEDARGYGVKIEYLKRILL